MLLLLLACALTSPSAISTRNAQDPPEESVQIAVRTLEAAYKLEASNSRAEALVGSAHIADPRVVMATAWALRDDSPNVRLAAIEALRFNAHPIALRSLHNELSKTNQTSAAPETTAALIRGVCQKAQVGSLPLVTSRNLDTTSRVAASSWILGMGRLRHRDSVEALIGFMGSLPESKRIVHMDEFRTSLMLLTGIDQGTDDDAWIRWWRESGDAVQVAPETPPAPDLVHQEWCDYWGIAPTDSNPAQFDVGPLPEVEPARIVPPREQAPKRQAKREKPKSKKVAPVEASAVVGAEAKDGDQGGEEDKAKANGKGKGKADAPGKGKANAEAKGKTENQKPKGGDAAAPGTPAAGKNKGGDAAKSNKGKAAAGKAAGGKGAGGKTPGGKAPDKSAKGKNGKNG